ncbi:hypothetical protein CHU32_16990 [Superficieibacter electus]|uniref:DUF3617 domain-containing protein n=1 Tax=Superficieibacter electus TaxID=2022662 RepID=A0A2P5GMH8_9ENTR|nr:DUF3617 family protein [Superficieibacter electus]POP41609.1 hypothetical protein CHU33_22270 [Superficieibacter electus]POP47038.1 hypothetical protein CHU32_16990 [Superficieibacter electus]
MKNLALIAISLFTMAGIQSASALDIQPGEWSMQVTGQPKSGLICVTPAMVKQYKLTTAGQEQSKDGCHSKILENTDTKLVTDLKCEKPEGKIDTHIVVVKKSDTEVITTTNLNIDASGKKVSTDMTSVQTFVSKDCSAAAVPAK